MKNLNHLRIDAGCSIAELARMMHVDERTVCLWLSGHDEPDPDERQRLAAILQVDPETLSEDSIPNRSRRENLRGKFAVYRR